MALSGQNKWNAPEGVPADSQYTEDGSNDTTRESTNSLRGPSVGWVFYSHKLA